MTAYVLFDLDETVLDRFHDTNLGFQPFGFAGGISPWRYSSESCFFCFRVLVSIIYLCLSKTVKLFTSLEELIQRQKIRFFIMW